MYYSSEDIILYSVVKHAGGVFEEISTKMSFIVQSVRWDCGDTSKRTGQHKLCVYGKRRYSNITVTELFRLEGTSWDHLPQLQLFFVC